MAISIISGGKQIQASQQGRRDILAIHIKYTIKPGWQAVKTGAVHGLQADKAYLNSATVIMGFPSTAVSLEDLLLRLAPQLVLPGPHALSVDPSAMDYHNNSIIGPALAYICFQSEIGGLRWWVTHRNPPSVRLRCVSAPGL